MINYFKKVVILKRVTNLNLKENKNVGCAIIEQINSDAIFNFELFSPVDNECEIYIANNTEKIEKFKGLNKVKFTLKLSDFNIKNGVIICIFKSENLIYYGEIGKPFLSLTEITNYAKKNNTNSNKKEDFTAKFEAHYSEQNASYDDEIIANENYYEIDEKQPIFNQDALEFIKGEKSQKIKENAYKFIQYEKDLRPFKTGEFYSKIKEKLNKIFDDFEEFSELKPLLKNSKFVKIHYAENKYYYVGAIYENNEIKYVCYAVLGRYNDVSKELFNYLNFIPISSFNQTNNGYFVIFQDAKTGEIIKKDND